MTFIQNDIELGKTEEAEERNATEVKVVETSDFHSEEASSNLVGSTNDWQTEKCGGDFTIKTINRQVAGENYSRLSVLRT